MPTVFDLFNLVSNSKEEIVEVWNKNNSYNC